MQDKLLLLSENQAITASAASDYYMDENGLSNPSKMFICEARVTTPFTGTAGSTLTVAVQVSATADFASTDTLAVSPPIPLASLTLGKQILVPIPHNFDNTKVYTRAYYTASTAFTAGAVTTCIQPDVFTNHS